MEVRAKVLLTDSQDGQTRLCEEALEKAGVQVIRCEKNGGAAGRLSARCRDAGTGRDQREDKV